MLSSGKMNGSQHEVAAHLLKALPLRKASRGKALASIISGISNLLEDNTYKDSIAVWLLLTRLQRRIMEKPESSSVSDHV